MLLSNFPGTWPLSKLENTLVILAALIAHQIFRRHETYSFLVHVSLVFGLPLCLAIAVSSGVCGPASSFVFAAPPILLLYLTCLATSIVMYRVSPFHPLARYPGPLIDRMSKFRMAWKSMGGKQHDCIKQLHDRYGDVVRIGPNELSIRDPSMVPALLGPSGLPKGPHFFGRLLSANILTMIALQDTDIHLQRRRPWARAFSPSALKEYQERITARARQLVSRLKDQQGPVALDAWMKYFTYDFMSDMAFGGGSELLSGDVKSDFWSVLEESLGLATFLGHVPWLGAYLGYAPPAAAQAHAVVAYCRQLATERIARGSVKEDIFHYLNHEDDPEKDSPPLAQLADDGLLAMIAGSDTVSSALTSIFCCLMAHPEAYKTLQAEIDQFHPAGEDPFDVAHHRDMPYLTAVINETLRLYPPVPGCTQRQAPHDSPGTMLGSLYVPPGTNVWVHAHSMHRDSRNFNPLPEGFWPERWLIAADDAVRATLSAHDERQELASSTQPAFSGVRKPDGFVHNEAAFIPFSHGPMNCVGKSLALQEIRTVVCGVLQRLHVRPAEDWTLEAYVAEYRDYFLTTRGRVPVLLDVRHI